MVRHVQRYKEFIMSRSIRFFVLSGLAIALVIAGIYAIGAPDSNPDSATKGQPASPAGTERSAAETQAAKP